jgi:hypothetical protein
VRATWTTPSGLRVRTVVPDSVADDTYGDQLTTGSELGPLALVAGRPHVV